MDGNGGRLVTAYTLPATNHSADGQGGGCTSTQRFAPLNKAPDSADVVAAWTAVMNLNRYVAAGLERRDPGQDRSRVTPQQRCQFLQ